jgi:proton-translocating NADH-quinone oxidoreductase chain M
MMNNSMLLWLNLGGLFGVLSLWWSNNKLVAHSLSIAVIMYINSLMLLLPYRGLIEELSLQLRELPNTIYLKYSLIYATGIDGFSVIMIVLSTFLFIICVLSAETIYYRKKLFFIMLFLTELALINLFAVSDLFFFYILFEGVLIPMFLIIGIWGSRTEKISAAYQFFLYTLMGSLFMLVAIIIIFLLIGTTNAWEIKGYQFPSLMEKLFWISFFLSFAIKIPMYPFHLWLPKAHVEAPTAGSVLLAGILLKLGGYGFIRFSLFLFPSSTIFFRPFVILLAFIAIIYSSFTILRQIDLKRIVAYSSIAHMNIFILGCFSGNIIALQGAILLMLAHGLVSGGLFLCVGYLYDRYKSRNLLYYRELKILMPFFGLFFFLLILSNLGFPPTLNFISECLIISGFMQSHQSLAFLIGVAIFFAGVSGFLTYSRIFFGNFSVTKGYADYYYYYDLTRREVLSMIPLIGLTFMGGLFPGVLLKLTNVSLSAWGI